MLRPILFLHRWFGVFVMMYGDYPRPHLADQLRGLTPLQLASAARLHADQLDGHQPLFPAPLPVRWAVLQDGQHSLDLPPLRQSPLREVVVLPLLALVTLVCGMGTWMGFSQIRRDLRRWRKWARS